MAIRAFFDRIQNDVIFARMNAANAGMALKLAGARASRIFRKKINPACHTFPARSWKIVQRPAGRFREDETSWAFYNPSSFLHLGPRNTLGTCFQWNVFSSFSANWPRA